MIKTVAFTLSLFLSSPLFSASTVVMVETNRPEDILHYVEQPGGWVVFELYDTVMATSQQLGSEQWAEWQISDYVHQGLSIQEARRGIVPLWNQILLQTKVEPVDPAMTSIYRTLQRQGVVTLGMTERDAEMSYTILKHLYAVDISLWRNNPSPAEGWVRGGDAPVKYLGGVLFTGVQNPLGASLLHFFDHIRRVPSYVVFVSSKAKSLNEMASYMQSRGVPFIGIRYSGADRRAAEFDIRVAKMQLRFFNRILHDDAAKAILPRKGLWDFFGQFWEHP